MDALADGGARARRARRPTPLRPDLAADDERRLRHAVGRAIGPGPFRLSDVVGHVERAGIPGGSRDALALLEEMVRRGYLRRIPSATAPP